MENDNGRIKIEEIGLDRLDEYGLWLQVIDETGQEVLCHNKPENYPARYSASELIALSVSAFEEENTVFVSSYESSEESWSYLIGFPYAIGKYMLYYNGENVGRLSPLFRMGILMILCFVLLFMVCYGFWLTRHLGRIAKGIEGISMRCYTPLIEKGMFGEVYEALNQMDTEIRHSDKVQQETERIRREWITNITHDLKTPLSPIKGYAELLVDGPASDKTVRLVRFLKELVIDIVNDPAFADRKIEFESNVEECEICLDVDLFRRAVNNIIMNALTHNPPETRVVIRIDTDPEKGMRSQSRS